MSNRRVFNFYEKGYWSLDSIIKKKVYRTG